MNPLHLLPTVFLIPALAPSTAGDGPTLSFEKGRTVRQSWTLTQEREVESSTLQIMGNEQDVGSGSSVSSSRSMEVLDTVLAAEEGRLMALRRDHETLSAGRDVEGIESSEGVVVQEGGETSPLEGLAVTFTRGEGGAFEAAWADEDDQGEDAWLEGLRAMGYLDGLLPADEIAEGDTWELPGSFVAQLLSPLGQVDVDDEGGPDAPEGAIAISIPTPGDLLDWTDMEGDIVARWESTETEDGPRRARIVLTLDLETTFDLVDRLEDAAVERGADESYDSAELVRTLEGEVIVLWDLDAHLPMSVDGELEGTSVFDAAWTLAANGLDLDIAVAQESSEIIEVAGRFAVE